MESPVRGDSSPRSQVEFPRRVRSPYLQDTCESQSAVRIPRQLIESLPEITPRSCLSQSMVYNDEGSEMFRAVRERKYAKERLEAMTNRIQSLRFAELKAQKRLNEVRKLTTAKAQQRELKQKVSRTQVEEGKRQWRQQVQMERLSAKMKVDAERSEAKERLLQAREALLRMKKVTTTQEQVGSVKRENDRKHEEMLSYLDEDFTRRASRKAAVAMSIKKAHARNLSLDSENRERIKTQFQAKKGMEMTVKNEMERRVKELEALEQGIVDNLKRTLLSHEEEIAKLEQLVTRPRLSSSVGFTLPKAFVTEEESATT